MKTLEQIASDYEMGFITSQEFIAQCTRILSLMGAEKELTDIVNDINSPFANFLLGIIRGSGENIRDFKY